MELSSFDFREYLYWGERGKNIKNSYFYGLQRTDILWDFVYKEQTFVIHF
jgi:hypothetical protein